MQAITNNNEHHDTEIWFGQSAFPGWRRDDDTLLVDFRLYGRGEAHPRLDFYPERLAEMGVSDAVILAAAEGDGFVVFDHQ